MLVSLMGSSILSEVYETPSILRTELSSASAILDYRPLGSCSPRSGLERSDFVPWQETDLFLAGRNARCRDKRGRGRYTISDRRTTTAALVGMLLRVASGELSKQILVAILPQKLEQVRKSLAKQRDMCTHDLAGLRRVAAKDCHHNLFVFGDR